MTDYVMMKCGHTANATVSTRVGAGRVDKPGCAICSCSEVAESSPDLSGRNARCAYYGRPIPARHRTGKQTHCNAQAVSLLSLAFFEYRGPGTTAFSGEAPFDTYYCGCFGWD